LLILFRDNWIFYSFKVALTMFMLRIFFALYQHLLEFIWTENYVLNYSIFEGFFTCVREVQDFE
jgi:hypothetical protein